MTSNETNAGRRTSVCLKPVDLRRLVRHAELYGTDEVYEVALEIDLAADELGSLARRLPNIDKSWRLSRAQAGDLAVKLIRVGMRDRDILDTCRISRPTLREAHSKAADCESFAPTDPIGQIGDFVHFEPSEALRAEVVV
jgi:hypothetical protein